MLKDFFANALVKHTMNRHIPGDLPNVFLAATPRGGSTWLMELLWSQPGFKVCNEPLDLRNPLVRRHLGIDSWQELYSEGSTGKLEAYFRAFHEGRLHIVEPLPHRAKYYRRRTSRIVFKLLHGCEDRIPWLAERFNGVPLLLVRHPVPTTLSRKKLPRLEAFQTSDYSRHFDSHQLKTAARITRSGSDFQKGVLDWCLQNAVPLRMARNGWSVVTYEQLVLEPEVVIPRLAEDLALPDPELMLGRLNEASSVTYQSDAATKRLLSNAQLGEARSALVSKWLKRVSTEEQEAAREILETFEIDAYSAFEPLPSASYTISGRQTKRGLVEAPASVHIQAV